LQTIAYAETRMVAREDPSIHAIYSCFSEPKENECLHSLQAKYKMSRLQIARLKKEILESISMGGVQLNAELNRYKPAKIV